MENNEILMDVKLELHDKKPESTQFRNWTKCLVKIEAIKCFPCYIRITFIKNLEDEQSNLCVRINIPGVAVRFATSRTKLHSYGLFWKQNRKRCSIFFSLDSQISCERHMKWVKKSIKNLELHRQEILETRRTSRSSLDGTTISKPRKNLKDLQDILGPLPKIPDFRDSGNWSRRISGMSGIYEEIPDGGERNSRRLSRTSVASGIYEEMKPLTDMEKICEFDNFMTPPPVPPRKRLNTFQGEIGKIPRSYTNPETEMAKKKKYLTILENVFGRSKRSDSVSEGKVSKPIDFLNAPEQITSKNQDVTPRPKKKQKLFENKSDVTKRNSFSSPDLSKLNHFDEFDALDDLSSLSSELQIHDLSDCSISNEYIPINLPTKSDPEIDVDNLNISEQIQPNFNFSFNSSTINLVGANLNNTKSEPVNIVIDDDMSGYCLMAPLKKYRNKSSNDSDKENNENNLQEIDTTDKMIYENMTALSKICIEETKTDPIYQNLSEEDENILSLAENELNMKKNDSLEKTPRKSLNIDDKIPSYYPNSCDTLKTRRRQDKNHNIKHLTGVKVSHNENLYISSPQKILDERSKKIDFTKSDAIDNDSIKVAILKASKTSKNLYTVTKISDHNNVIPESRKIVSISIESDNIDENLTKTNDIKTNTPRLYQKYATLARISPNKYLDKCSKKTTDLSNIKKFASLPRFKKIDFSPLKMKITNALHRHQNDGF